MIPDVRLHFTRTDNRSQELILSASLAGRAEKKDDLWDVKATDPAHGVGRIISSSGFEGKRLPVPRISIV